MDQDQYLKKVSNKKFIRNTEQPKPQTVVLLHSEVPKFSSLKKPEEKSAPKMAKKVDSITFETPELNTAMKIVKDIESVASLKPKKVKSMMDITKNKQLVVEEKASKLVNFPYNKNIYKDLIPLYTKPSPPPDVSSSTRTFSLQKDLEPTLSDFFEPKRLPEYKFQATTQLNQKNFVRQYDGLKLYRTMKSWD